jgi:prepilin-type N-terminal cleavage/methylation domain-containing protein
MHTQKKGFTLIELLIVIGILAVLATVTVLVLNPAELFRQARDSQRLSDLGSIKGALGLYITTVSSPSLSGGTITCGTNFGASVAAASSTFTASLTQGNSGAAAIYKTDGTGWVSVDLADMPGGSPLSVLPRDPRNEAGGTPATNLYYTYACDSTSPSFLLKAKMESSRYANGGADDVESTDGGPDITRYETGTVPNLSL